MRRGVRLFKFAGMLAALFAVGIFLGLGYDWFRGIPPEFFITAAGNAAPSEAAIPAANALLPAIPAGSITSPPPKPSVQTAAQAPTDLAAKMMLPAKPNSSQAAPIKPKATTANNSGNVMVLNSMVPPASQSPTVKNELTLPHADLSQGSSADRLPAIGDEGQTIWVPRAIEGCWVGSGDASLQYLGGCPNIFSGATSPVRLRWCFRRTGDRPLTLVMAKGQYPGRVSQKWNVTGARGQTIDLRETIGYETMIVMHVVDVGDWTCHIEADNELICGEHELARCGPGNWLQVPWFRGSGEVTARRAREGNYGGRFTSEP